MPVVQRRRLRHSLLYMQLYIPDNKSVPRNRAGGAAPRHPLIPAAASTPQSYLSLWSQPPTLNPDLPLTLISRRLLILPRGQKNNGKHVSIYLDAPETQFKSTSPQVWNYVWEVN